MRTYLNDDEEFRDLVEAVVREPNSFIAMMELKSYITKIEKKQVSEETLFEMIDKLKEANMAMAFLLMYYAG